MDRCRICQAEAVYMAVLHDGARVAYCAQHLPEWQAPTDMTLEELVATLLKAYPE